MEIRTVRTPGLGDTTYVLSHADTVVVVDPQRDIDRFERVIEDTGGSLRFVLETHVHNDYISGGRDLARRYGAELIFPAGAAPAFRHRPAFHREDLNGGPVTIRPLHTPGHTPEHTSYLILLEGEAVAVFSGGSLLTGSAGRTDLLGWERAESLARLQYGSVHRLSSLPDHTRLCPTHGAGSFCSASPARRAESTIGEERLINPVLAHPDEDSFVLAQLSGLPDYPSYYRHMGPMNLAGSADTPVVSVPDLTAQQAHRVAGSATIVDGRPVDHFASGHIRGALSVELNRSYGVWVGWLVDFNSPLLLVLNPDQDAGEAIRQLTRIGFDDVRGVLRNLDEWSDALVVGHTADTAEFLRAVRSGAQILDTRARSEWEQGTIPGSRLIYVPDLPRTAREALDQTEPVWVLCATGFRAGIAGSLLEREGFQPMVLTGSGVEEVLIAMSDDG